MNDIKELLLFRIVDKGEAIVSTMSTEKALTYPIAGKLLVNMVIDLTEAR